MLNNWNRDRFVGSVPFYYGWVILAVSTLVAYSSRPLMAVTTLSVFVVPMTEHFGWSRGLFSGAVSLAGLCAVFISPFVGRLIDRFGSGLVLGVTSLIVGVCAIGVSLITQAWAFYAFYVPGRTVFASPLELATSTAISNWFIRRRPLALALLGGIQGSGLAVMPLVAQAIIGGWGWRVAWMALGAYTLSVGVVPALVLMVRRPEDIGLRADSYQTPNPGHSPPSDPSGHDAIFEHETNFTVGQALRTRAFWILAIFSGTGFMVQGGIALHHVSHYIYQGLAPSLAAIAATTFALSQIAGGFMWSIWARSIPVRFLLSLAGFTVAIGAVGTTFSASLGWGLSSAMALGVGVGGLHLLLRLAWADYYGRRHLGSIRGLALPAQIGGQALGPILAGFVFDARGTYDAAFLTMAVAVSLAALLVTAGTPPGRSNMTIDR